MNDFKMLLAGIGAVIAGAGEMSAYDPSPVSSALRVGFIAMCLLQLHFTPRDAEGQ